MRTQAVTTRTTLLLVRFRFHADIPLADGSIRPLVVEDARLLGFTGAPDEAMWLNDDEVETLVLAEPAGNVPTDMAASAAGRVLEHLGDVTQHLDQVADELADQVLASHRRARTGAGATRRGLKVVAQKPADVLGAYVYLPVAGASA